MGVDNGVGLGEGEGGGNRVSPPRRRRPDPTRGRSHVPDESVFYTKVVPLLLVAMAVVMAALILIAVGVLLGIVPFR
jgi:hypothetical protein